MSSDLEPAGEAPADEEPADEAEEPVEAPREPAEPTFVEILRDAYLSFDRRTLGFARFFLGFLVMMDLIHRSLVWEDMFGSRGVLPNDLALARPQAYGAYSLLFAFSTNAELWLLWAVMFATAFCLFIGYKTKVAQILTMIFVTSMNGRLLLVENGGYVVNNLLTMWTCFLPLGDRYSVDAMIESMKRRREATAADLDDRADLVPEEKRRPHVTVMGIILLIQLAAIYGFNVLHKTGLPWHNGTAVHFVFYTDRMVTPIVGLVRDHVPNWAVYFMTKSTMGMEAALPFALLIPVFRPWARRAAVFMINALHLAFGTAMVLGPFAWSCCVFSTLLFGKEDWALAYRTMRRHHRERVVVYRKGSGAAFFVCRVLARVDGLDLLTFRAEKKLVDGIVVEDGEGLRRGRSAALADIVAALPLGPCVAWIPRLPGLRSIIDALLARLERGRATRLFGARIPAATYVAPPRSDLRRRFLFGVAGLRELLAVAMFAGAVDQACNELWVVKNRIKVPQPEALRLLSHKLRFLQGWFMFSPIPVMDDGTIVVDAITRDGRHINPFTGKEPDWDLGNAKSLAYNQMWCDYYNRIQLPNNTGYRDAMKDYMLRYPERTGRPNDEIISGEVYWIHDLNPPWNSTKSYNFEKTKLFAFEAPKRSVN